MNKKLAFKNLQIKVMLGFIVIALGPLGIMGIFAIKTAEKLILNMARNQVEHIVRDKAVLLERWIAERKTDLEVVAGSSILKSKDPSLIAPYLELVRDRYKVYGGFIVLSRDGRILYDSSRQPPQNQRKKWFQEALAGRPHMSDIDFDAERKESFFLISTPLMDTSGEIQGAAAATVGTNVILSQVLHISLGETGECYLVSRNGTFLAHKDPTRILKENIAQSESFKNIFNAGKHGKTYIDYRGIEVIGASARVGGTDWALVVEQDKDEAFRDAVRLKHYIFLAMALATGGALVLAWLLSYYIVNPIRKLNLAAKCLAAGEFDRAHIEMDRADEIGMLVNAFEDMAHQLQDRQQMLEQRMELKQSELEKTGVKLKKTQQAAARSQQLASLGRLASGVAHEIRTPLTSLKLFLEAAESDIATSPDYAEDFRIAMNQIRRMEATINRFLDFTRPQDPVFASVRTADLIEDALLVIGPRARQQETVIERSIQEPLPMLTGDRKRLGEALLNLMVNGLEAMAHRGRLSVYAYPDVIQGKEGRRPGVRIDIKDTGPGIAQQDMSRLFEPFFTTKATGAGLGLAIVSSIIQGHGGEILVHSTAEEGTTFSVLLPAEGAKLIGEDG